MVAPYEAFRCSDGYITLGASNDRLFERLCHVLGHPEWAGIPDFRDNASRVRNRVALGERINAVTSQRATREWLAAFEANDIPSGPLNSYADAFADPHVLARDMVIDLDHPTLGPMRTIGSPIKLSATPPDVRRRAPHLGEHTEQVLREAGFGEAEVAALAPVTG